MTLVLRSAEADDSSGLRGRRAVEIAITGDRPFGYLDDFISREELRALSDRYKRIAGCSIEDLAAPAARSAT
jgi:hypothetical protein